MLEPSSAQLSESFETTQETPSCDVSVGPRLKWERPTVAEHADRILEGGTNNVSEGPGYGFLTS